MSIVMKFSSPIHRNSQIWQKLRQLSGLGIFCGFSTKIITSLTSCDYSRVMLCQNYTLVFFSSMILAVIFYMLANTMLLFLSIPLFGMLLFYSILFLALWFSYAWSTLCFPIIPPWFANDLLFRITSIFPLSTLLPPQIWFVSGIVVAGYCHTMLFAILWAWPVHQTFLTINMMVEVPWEYGPIDIRVYLIY